MKKNLFILSIFIAFWVNTYAQIQFDLDSETPFEGVYNSSIAIDDVDNDGDQDVLITGYNSYNQSIAKLYRNNGSGSFDQVIGTPFEGVFYSSIAFADVDGDGDQDVLITGKNSTNAAIAKLYRNNGSCNFSLVSGTPFEGVFYSSIAFADVDGDLDQDVLITGFTNNAEKIANLYTNDGEGNFSLVSGTPFDGVYYGSTAFADVDEDGDKDVLITGQNSSGQKIAKLYTNDGEGNFSLVNGTPFSWVRYSSIAFVDVDGDDDQDVLITGQDLNNQSIAKLYKNNGSGSYTLAGATFDGVQFGSIAFADVDGDLDEDVLITGKNTYGIAIIRLYCNNGNGSFSLISGTPFDSVFSGSIAFADMNGDGDQDVLITGNSSQRIAKLYINNTTYISTETLSDGDWASISWSNGTPDGTLYQPIISNTVTLNDAISIRDLEISSGGTLDINSNVTVISDVTLQSNASLTGQENLTINGTLSIEREITGYSSSSDGWHFLSSPVSSQTIAGSDFVPAAGDDLFEYGEASGRWLNFTDGSFGDSEFEVGKGYLVAYDNTATKEFTGNFNTGPVTKNLTYNAGMGDGYNLLGNPYPSAIDWDVVTRSLGVDNAVYIVNSIDGTYKSWVEGVGDITDGEIPVNQGFFVKANSGGQSVTMELADQVHSSNNFNKSTQALPEKTLKISLNGANSENNTYVRFRYDATEHFDSHSDAYKLFGFAVIPQVYTHLEETDYSINALNFSTEAISIPLGIYLNAEEDLSFQFTGLEGFDSNTRIELEDKTANKIIHLREQASYNFRGVTSDEAERFVLHFSQVTGVDDLEAQAAQVYTANGRVYVRQDESNSFNQMLVYDLAGRLVAKYPLTEQNLQSYDLSQLRGVFLVQLVSGDSNIEQKIVLK